MSCRPIDFAQAHASDALPTMVRGTGQSAWRLWVNAVRGFWRQNSPAISIRQLTAGLRAGPHGEYLVSFAEGP